MIPRKLKETHLVGNHVKINYDRRTWINCLMKFKAFQSLRSFLFDRGPLCGLPLVAFKMWLKCQYLASVHKYIIVSWKHLNITPNPFQPPLFANEHAIFMLPTVETRDALIHIFSPPIQSRYMNLDIFRYQYHSNTRALFALILLLSLLLFIPSQTLYYLHCPVECHALFPEGSPSDLTSL